MSKKLTIFPFEHNNLKVKSNQNRVPLDIYASTCAPVECVEIWSGLPCAGNPSARTVLRQKHEQGVRKFYQFYLWTV